MKGGSFEALKAGISAVRTVKEGQPPKGVSLTKTEPCLVIDDPTDPDWRVKMPCGHVYHPSSLYGYVASNIGMGWDEIKCPAVKNTATGKLCAHLGESSCNTVWDYPTLRYALALSGVEMQSIEEILSKNHFDKKGDLAMLCHECKFSMERPDRTTLRLECPGCRYVEKASNPHICSQCNKRWQTADASRVCGNEGCDSFFEEQIVNVLKAPIITKDGGPVPKRRACPRRHADGKLFICEWESACKHITCLHCQKPFCFRCLALEPWPPSCGSSGTVCAMAPIQSREAILALM